MYVQTINFKAPNAGKELIEALTSTGFAILENHPVPHSLLEESLEDWKAFFASEKKFEYLSSDEKWGKYRYLQGYFPLFAENAKQTDEKNLLEYFHYYQQFGLPAAVNQRTALLFDHLKALAQKIIEFIQEESPPDIKAKYPTPLPDMLKGSADILMRFLHYPPLDKQDLGKQRNIEHEDAGLLTLLPIATAPGLQVQDVKGRWHDVACAPTTIVVNAADMLQHTSGHYFRSTTHRVITPEGYADKPRYSMTMFVPARDDCLLSPGVTAGEFLRQRLKENGVYGQ